MTTQLESSVLSSASAFAPNAVDRAGPLSQREVAILTAVAEAAMPAGEFLEGAGRPTALAVDRWLGRLGAAPAGVIRAAVWALELHTMPTHFRAFSGLSLDERMAVLQSCEQSRQPVVRNLLRTVVTPLKQKHFARADMFLSIACRFSIPTLKDENPRCMHQINNER